MANGKEKPEEKQRVGKNGISAGKGEKDEEPTITTPKPVDMFEVPLPYGYPNQSQVDVGLQRTKIPFTSDLALWMIIRRSTEAISFNDYMTFMDGVMCGTQDISKRDPRVFELRMPFPGVDAYSLLKVATEVFLMTNCGVAMKNARKDEKVMFDENNEKYYVTGAILSNSDVKDAENRLGRKISDQEANEWINNYLSVVDGKAKEGGGYEGTITIPYLELIRYKLKDIPIKPSKDAQNCFGILEEKLKYPCFLELIWSYWHEEGMLVQAMNAISLRFQNKQGSSGKDPLARIELDPLRPLNNILWGYIQDEQHRLTLPRRAYEYDHHYGMTLYGKAVPTLKPVDSRSKFIEAFHNLLHLCSNFYKQDDNTMVIADGFPLLNGLKEVHLLLTEGHHNQYGDLPWTARMEMLMMEWLLARPEMRQFLSSRIMVAYPESWMEGVDTMKKMQGWSNTPVMHFSNLGKFGEQVLLSIRFGAWSEVNDRNQAANWARYWRSEIQGYIHAYRAVTSVDLTTTTAANKIDAVLPSEHLKRQLELQSASKK